jgi:hypothetical protein
MAVGELFTQHILQEAHFYIILINILMNIRRGGLNDSCL